MSRKGLLSIAGIALAVLVFGGLSVWADTITVDDSGGAAHTTIQAAIDAASAGDTILVNDGTYTEDLVVNKADLTLRSQNGKGSTAIQLVDGVGIDIQGGASGFTLGGAAGEGFAVSAAGTTTFNIQLTNAPSDVEISHNDIDSTGNGGKICLNVGAAGAANLSITNNNFTSEAGDGAIWGPNVVDVDVSDNTFTGGSYAIQFSGVTATSPSTISGNTISGYTGSGGIVISNGAGTSDLAITDNTISGCTNGIYFVEYCAEGTADDMTTVSVTGNTLNTNTTGLKIGDGPHVLASQFTIEHNEFQGNTTGLDNQHATEAVTAEDNWWGTANGPAHATNTFNVGAQGNAVSDNVDFVPWYNTDMTGTSWGPVYNPAASYYSSIQAAVDAASAGHTITCADGTYTEDVVVNKANLTLKSQTGRDNTILQLVDGVGLDIQAGGDGFTLGGVTSEGFTINSGVGAATTTFNIQLANAPAGVEISYNTIDTTGSASMGISIGAAGAAGLTITENEFVAEDGDGSIWGPKVHDVTVNDNTFTGPASPTNGYAVQFAGVTASSPSTISENTITNYGMGIAVFNGEGTSDLLISDNNITGCLTGIRLGQYSPGALGDMTTVSVFGNTLTSNTTGLQINDGANVKCDQFTVKLNNFVGNTTGLANQHATLGVTAEENWWNHDSGPQHPTNLGASGDPVVGNVDFTPWLRSAVTETVTADVANGSTLDGRPGVSGSVTVTGATTTVTLGEYGTNPTGTGFGTSEAGYIDVYVPDITGLTKVEIRLYYPTTLTGADETNLKLYWWNSATSAWVECSNQTVNAADIAGPPAYGGYISVLVTPTSMPSLAQLQGTIFGGGSSLPASAFWFEDFEYTDQAAMETAGWVFGANAEQLWHLTAEAAVPTLAYPNLAAFPSSNHAAWFGKPISGSYGPTSVSSKAVSPEARAQRTRIQPMGAGGGYPYGELTSPAIDVTGQASIDISFQSYREVECYPQGHYDRTDVLVSFNDGATWQKVWGLDSTACAGMRQWLAAGGAAIPVAVPAGATSMKIRFVFDAVDNVANDYLGWLIDDLKVSSTGPAGLRFEEESLPEGLLDQAYSATIHAVGGTASVTYAWRVISNTADSWLTVTLGATTATLSGTPTVAGTYQLCIGVSDDRGQTYSRCYDIIIEQLIAGGELFYDDFESVDGWTTTGLWHRTENTPCVDPSYASPTHVYYYGKDATCNYATSGANSGTLTSPAIDVSGLAPGSQLTIGWKYWREVELYLNGAFDQSSVEISFDGGTTWTLIWYDDSKQNELMGGWHLVEATQSTVGAATIVVPLGASSLRVRFRFVTGDGYANNYVGWLIDDVKVIQQVAGVSSLDITSICDDLPDGTANVAYSAQLTATGGVLPYTWTWTVGPIAGLTLNPGTGAIAGTPTAAGTYQCTFQVADNVGFTVVLGPCEIVIAPAPPCPCDLAAIDFENGVGGSLVDDILAPALWTVTNLWHLAGIGGCVTCPEIIDHYAYFGIDASCTFNTGARVSGYLTSPVIAVDPCISEVAIGFDHFRQVEFLATGMFDRTTVQVRWDGGAWQTVWMRHSANPSPNCEQLAIGPIPVAGAQLEVRFGFDSIDKLFNKFIGWALDHVWIKNYACAGGPFVSPLRALWAKDEARDEFTVLNIPNPVRDVHTTTFSVRGEGIEAIRIQIFDVDQQLMYEEEVDGEDLVWHTVNNYGEYLANGVYFYRALVKKGGIWLTTPFEKLVILR